MTSPAVTITGRVAGPDGLGRMGRITLTPTGLDAPLPARDIVAGRVSARIGPDGYLVGPTGRSVTVSPGSYEIDLIIPGDLGAHIRTTRTLSDGETLNIADVLTTSSVPNPSPGDQNHGVRDTGQSGILEAINGSEVIDLGNGVLTWR